MGQHEPEKREARSTSVSEEMAEEKCGKYKRLARYRGCHATFTYMTKTDKATPIAQARPTLKVMALVPYRTNTIRIKKAMTRNMINTAKRKRKKRRGD